MSDDHHTLQPIQTNEDDAYGDECLQSDLISPSYFYSNEQHPHLLKNTQLEEREDSSHYQLISKMKNLDSLSGTEEDVDEDPGF